MPVLVDQLGRYTMYTGIGSGRVRTRCPRGDQQAERREGQGAALPDVGDRHIQ
jgi:hypothetical protein